LRLRLAHPVNKMANNRSNNSNNNNNNNKMAISFDEMIQAGT